MWIVCDFMLLMPNEKVDQLLGAGHALIVDWIC